MKKTAMERVTTEAGQQRFHRRYYESVCALVITFNRLPQLQECITAIRSQTTPPNEIVVVDNGSTDQTLEWLREQLDITVLSQTNSGVAGGIYSGLKYSYERDYSWTWINDDDAFPAPNALEQLLLATSHRPAGRVFNSLSIDQSDSSRIAFHFVRYPKGDNKRKKRYDYVRDLLTEAESPFVEGEAQFYQSSLLHREVVQDVGLPLPDLFIRGDEAEYLQRIIARGFTTYTVTDSRVVHPQQKREAARILGKEFYYEPMGKLKRYYIARNAVWGNHHFPGAWGPPSKRWLRFIKIFTYNQVVAWVTIPGLSEKISGSYAACRAVSDGLRMDRNARIRGKPTIYRDPILVRQGTVTARTR